VLLALLFIGASFILGAYVGYQQRPYVDLVRNILNIKETAIAEPVEVDFGPFWKAWHLIETKYVAGEEIDRQDLLWGAISGLSSAVGDPYTVFFPPEENEYFESEVKGVFGGIGAEIGIRKNNLVIISPLEDSPAKRAGLKAGDRVLEIDGENTSGMTLDEAVRRIRGEKGTVVVLTVFGEEEEEPKEIGITRDIINVPVLKTEHDEEKNIFIIKLFSFSARSGQEFRNAIREFILSGADKLILDLRNNPGGFLDSAIDIASWFLPKGEIVAVEEFRDRDPVEYRSNGYAVVRGLKMVVLVNQGSASASEIVAGALQDHGIATIMGEKTFGKGSVQELNNITQDTSLKITIARWLTPTGRSISKEGLEPDIIITKEETENPEDDIFMIKAKEFLLQ